MSDKSKTSVSVKEESSFRSQTKSAKVTSSSSDGQHTSMSAHEKRTSSKTQRSMQSFEDFVFRPTIAAGNAIGIGSNFEDVSKQICHVNDGDTFEMKLDVQEYKPDEVQVKITDNLVTITGKQEERKDEKNFRSREFSKKFTIPNGVKVENISCTMTTQGMLKISAPIEPQGRPGLSRRQIQEIRQESVNSSRKSSISSDISSVSQTAQSRFDDELVLHPKVNTTVRKTDSKNQDVTREISSTNDGKTFEMKLEINNFKSEEIDIKISKNLIKIEGKHEDKFSSRSFYKEFTIPHGVRANTIQCSLDEGILTITAPIQQSQPAISSSTKSTQEQQLEAVNQTTQQQVTSAHKTVKKQLQQYERTDSDSTVTSNVSSIQDSRRIGDDFIVRPIIDRSISKDMILNFEDVSKQVCLATDKKNFEVKIEVSEYKPDELVVKITDNMVSIEGKHEVKEENKFSMRQFSKKFTIPEGVKPESITSTLSNTGVLTISAPIEINARNQEALTESTSDISNVSKTQQQTTTQQTQVTQQRQVEKQEYHVVQQEQQRVVQEEKQHVVQQQQERVEQQEQQRVVQQEQQHVVQQEQQRVVQQEQQHVKQEQQRVVQQEQQHVVQQEQQHVVQQEQQHVVQQEQRVEEQKTTVDAVKPQDVAQQQDLTSANIVKQQETEHQQHKLTALNIEKHQSQIPETDEEESLITPIIEPESPSVTDVRFEDVSKQICRASDGKIFEMKFDIPEYKPTEIQIKISEGMVTIEGKHETENTSRSFFKKFSIPQGVKPEEIKNKFSPKGVLTISAPIHSTQPQAQQATTTKTEDQTLSVEKQEQESRQQHKITESDSLSSIASTTSTVTEAVRKVGENYFLRPTMSTVSVLEDTRFEDVSKEVTRVNEGKTFETKLNVPEYKPEELQVKIADNMVTVEGKQETANSSRSFFKKFTIPKGVKPEDITSSLNPQGVLTISAPIHSTQPQPALLPEQQHTSTLKSDEQVSAETSVRKLQEAAVHQISQSDSLNSISSITSTVNESVRRVGENYILRPMSVDNVVEDSRFEDVSKQVARVDEGKKFETTFNVPEYKPEELQVKISQNMVTIEGKQETTNSSRSFFKKFTIPQGVKPEDITSSLTPQGVLTISAPIQCTQTHDLQQQHQKSTTKTQEVTVSQTKEQEQTKHQQQVTESDNRSSVKNSMSSILESIRKVGENFILRPTMGVPNVVAEDTRFEDVSKQVARVDEGKKFETKLDVPEYKPEELQVRISDNMVTIEGKQETANSSRSFFKKFTIPYGVKPEDITSSLSPQGVLTISAPIQSIQTQSIQAEQQVNTSTSRTEQAVSQTAVRKQELQSVHQQSSISDSRISSSVLDSQRRTDDDFVIRPIRSIDNLLEKDSRFEDVSKQISRLEDQKKFEMKFDVPEYKPEELQIKISDNMVIIEGKQETANSSRSFFKKFSIPQGVKPENITSSFSVKGVLTISSIIETNDQQSRQALSSSTTNTSQSQKQQSISSSTNISNVSSDKRNREVFLQPKLNFDALLSENSLFEDVSKQISHSTDKKTFEVKLDVQEYKPEEIEVRISNNLVTIEGKQEIRQESSFKSRSFSKKFSIPQGVKPESIKCILSADGLLSLTAPVDTTNLALTETVSGTTSVSQHQQQQSREQRVQASSTTKKMSSSVSSTRTSSNF